MTDRSNHQATRVRRTSDAGNPEMTHRRYWTLGKYDPERLAAELADPSRRAGKAFEARYKGKCAMCSKPIEVGEWCRYSQTGKPAHQECWWKDHDARQERRKTDRAEANKRRAEKAARKATGPDRRRAAIERQRAAGRFIDSRKTADGGWTRAQLAEWGISWPPPKGWRGTLIGDLSTGRVVVPGWEAPKP